MAEAIIEGYRGFLFIGDPHVASRKPQRRIDDFTTAVLDNLAQAARIASERQLVPVILGDLFHRADENHLPTLNRLMATLGQFPCVPVCLDGNHDMSLASGLNETDALSLMALAGVVRLADGPGSVFGRYRFGERVVALVALPYGCEWPRKIAVEGVDAVVAISHHDLDFDGAYPGAAPIREIQGVDMLVNGHMHKTLPSRQVGRMWAHNPGNIARLSIDVADHVESVWSWPGAGGDWVLEQHRLDFEFDVFDRVEETVAAADSATAAAAAPSVFAQLLSSTASVDAKRSEDAQVFMDDLDAVLSAAGASQGASMLLRKLAEDVAKSA